MSWTSLLIGTLVRDGRLTRQTTLGEIFDEDVWSDVDDAEAKRRITIEDLLQMESGYTDDGGYLGHVFGGNTDGLDVIGSVEELETMSWCAHLAAVPEAVRELNALEELYFVDPANDNTGAAKEADEMGTPTALPCFGSSSGDTPSSPCPEPRSWNLRGRR